MAKTIAIFGAGTGLGASVAHRFGREGYSVALVARRKQPLEALVEKLTAEGVEAVAFTADLSRPAAVPLLIAAIKAHFGRIDVIEYAPITAAPFTAATDLDAQKLEALVNLYLLTPVELVRAVLPEMLERGDGAILIGHGLSAVHPTPYMSGVAPVMAAARNYVYSLNGELAGRGVYAGTLTVTALIARSAGHQAITSGEVTLDLPPGTELPVVSPDELADQYWDLFAKRDRVEQIYPPVPAAAAA